MPLKSASKSQITIIKAKQLSRISWLIHGFSTRTNGFSRTYGGKALNLGFTKQDSRAAVERNRGVFLKHVAAFDRNRTWPLVTLRQIHSDIIHHVSSRPKSPLAGDGVITESPGIVLGIQTADCLPIILVDRRRRAVGVFHAGWRGTLQRIIEKGVGEMHRFFATHPIDIRAAIGPGVQGCCYQVGPELREQFESQFPYAARLFREVKNSDPVRQKYPLLFLTARAPGHSDLPRQIFLDLAEANRRQLLATGVLAKNITVSPLCTVCRTDLLFSYRAENGQTGRLMGVVGIRA